MLEPIPFAGFVEIDDPIVCCNHDCNQGRDCPLRTKTLTDAEIGELIGQYSHYENWEGFARAILRKAQEK